MPGTSHMLWRTAAMAMAALPEAEDQRSKGDRKPDDWLGCIMIRSIHPGPRSPLECYEFISGGGWQPQVAGGGTFPCSPQSSPPLSPPSSVIRHRLSHHLISGGGWQPQVSGGGTFPFSPPCSPQLSPPLSPPSSAICHPPSNPTRSTSTPAPPTTPYRGRRSRSGSR